MPQQGIVAERLRAAAEYAELAETKGYSVTLRLTARGVYVQASRNFATRTATVTLEDIECPVYEVLDSVLRRVVTDLPVMDWERARGLVLTHADADARALEDA